MELTSFIEEIIREAGKITLKYFNSPQLVVDHKADASPVTIADKSAEEYLRSRIQKAFPDDGIVGEEFGNEHETAKRRWILDPIDGTKTFIRGVPMYGTLIGVEEGDEVIAGAIYIPPLDELVIAERGKGCFHNGKQCWVSEIDSLDKAAILTTNDRRLRADLGSYKYHAITEGAGLYRSWGDCYGHLLVATGRAEAMLDPKMAVWDCAPMAVITEEAGGRYSDFDGKRTIRGHSLLTTNTAIASQIRSLIGAKEA